MKPSLRLGLVVFACFASSVTSDSRSDAAKEDAAQVVRRWETASRTFDKLVWPQSQLFIAAIRSLNQDASTLNISSSCQTALNTVADGLVKRKHWAVKFVDATGKGRSGMAYGYASDIGNMDECLSIDTQVASVPVSGQYCMVNLDFPMLNKSHVDYMKKVRFDLKGSSLEDTVYELYADYMELMMYTPTAFRFGVCFPSSCDKDELQRFLTKSFKGTEIDPVVSPFCETKGRPIATHHLVAMAFAVSYLAFVIAANIYTGIPDQQNTMLEHFSIVKNTQKLFVESTDPLSQRISFFHGIRFYYQLVVVSAHICDIQPFLSALYPVFYERDHHWFVKQLYRSTGFFVQIPFAISGALTCCMMYPYFQKHKGRVTFFDFTFKRWFRTTPTLVGVMIMSFAWAGWGNGPIFREGMEMSVETCKTHWWANILYINNWFPYEQLCLFHTWTFSADFQLYMISFIVLSLMFKKQIYGVVAAIGLMVLSVFMSGFVTWYKGMPPYPNFDATDSREYDLSGWIYFHTYHQMGPYFLGFLVGYCIIENKKLPDKLLIPGYLLLTVLCFPMVWIPANWAVSDEEPHRWLEIVYAGVHRLIFVSCFVWTGYLSAFNMGWIFQWLYEIKLWVPFGRMSSTIFLAHFTFIWYDVPNSQDYVPIRVYNLVMKFIYSLIMSWVYSYFIYLLFEAPSMSWAKVRMRKESMSGASPVAQQMKDVVKEDKNLERALRQDASFKLKGA